VSKLRVNAFSVSADGFGAGPDQGRDRPLGRGGEPSGKSRGEMAGRPASTTTSRHAQRSRDKRLTLVRAVIIEPASAHSRGRD
jgi:hypothetical protein